MSNFVDKRSKKFRSMWYSNISGWVTVPIPIVLGIAYYLDKLGFWSIIFVAVSLASRLIVIEMAKFYDKRTGLINDDYILKLVRTHKRHTLLYTITNVYDYKITTDFITVRGIIIVHDSRVSSNLPSTFKRSLRIPRLFVDKGIVENFQYLKESNRMYVIKLKEMEDERGAM